MSKIQIDGLPSGEGQLSSLVMYAEGSATSQDVRTDREKVPTSSHDNNDNGTKKVEQSLERFLEKEKSAPIGPRELGITWNNLTVTGVSNDAAIHENFFSQFDFPRMIRQARHHSSTRAILDKSHGCVKPGEMLLVLGRPGSGCTTLLNILANRRRGFESVTGNVFYGSMNHKEAEQYTGHIVMNAEEELFFPSLTVKQTMDFATRLKVPQNRPPSERDSGQKSYRDLLLNRLGISHTRNTRIGNEYIRGISGGERKRVSIAECLTTNASVFCWDNSTRGLDASTALEYIRTLRAFTDVRGLATIVTLYQPGNGIYDLFDKVLILDRGQQIFLGPIKSARPFMEDLGFECIAGANNADFLTGLTVPTERIVKPEYVKTFPRTVAQLREVYEASEICKAMIAEKNYPDTSLAKERTATFRQTMASENCSTKFTVSFSEQIRVCMIRQYQMLWGDKKTLVAKLISSTILALILGSLFYDAPGNSAGLFIKSGALFFALLYNTLMSMTEVADSFQGRSVLLKQKYYSFNWLAAYHIAQIVADIPVIAFRITIFSVVLYFMVGLKQTAQAFFTYWILLFVTALTMTALFRAIGAISSTFDNAAKWAGICVGTVNLYTGYMLNYHQMHPWFIWLFWIDPLAYAFNGLLSNELHGDVIECDGANLVPIGAEYLNTTHYSCTGVGSFAQGRTSFTGDAYLQSLTYDYHELWRNFGVLWPFWFLFAITTIGFSLRWRFTSDGGAALLVPRERKSKFLRMTSWDSEAGILKNGSPCQSSSDTPKTSAHPETFDSKSSEDLRQAPNLVAPNKAQKIGRSVVSVSTDNFARISGGIARNTSILTWKNLCYTIKTPEGDRTLLDQVHGWVKPGMLGALMGASGAGKTTLMDVLAQRKNEGVISGSILVDGQRLPDSFRRLIGFCEQNDVHEPFATVREALEFSALLRQNRDTPREEKINYVQTIIDLLELNDLADTLIGHPAAGLSLEQRKRVTIGVELVAKPQVLIFLDEPTTGTDSQTAFNTVRFLRKLAEVGQAVLVTIHQPSAQVFAQFDTILLLAKGGRVAYFGDIGTESAHIIKNYFIRNGAAPCHTDRNPAEYIIDVVSSSWGSQQDWSQIWLKSPEYVAVMQELQRIEADQIKISLRKTKLNHHDDEYASSHLEQIRMVTLRTCVSLFRNTDYINNKLLLHIFSALFNGFSFWMINDSVASLHSRLFATFNFIFVAPGALNQLQPLFIERRNIFETRESKSKTYSWFAFTFAVVVSELPWLCVCAVLYLVCWFWTVGYPTNRAGPVLFVMIMYEFVYTGIGELVAACAPNAAFAAFASPVLIGLLAPFCGILVPYAQIQAFWRYWLYYINPFTYLMGSMLTFNIWGTPVTCQPSEFAIFDPPNGSTCEQYLESYLSGPGSGSYLDNPTSTDSCRVCEFRNGSDYLRTLSLTTYSVGWRDAGIVAAYAVAAYAAVFLAMKIRSGTSRGIRFKD